MRAANVSRKPELSDTFTDTELIESLIKLLGRGWVITRGHGKYSFIGPGKTKEDENLRGLLNKVTLERMERFL